MNTQGQPDWQVLIGAVSSWIVPALFLIIVIYGYLKKVAVYEVFIEGAKEGFTTAINIIPYLVAIFAAIALFQASGAMKFVADTVALIVSPAVMPSDVLLMALIKPLSGSGARGFMLDIFQRFGVDSYAGFLASTIQGSTETTFYVIAVYFGAVGVKNARYTVAVGLIAELVAVVVSIALSYMWWHAGR